MLAASLSTFQISMMVQKYFHFMQCGNIVTFNYYMAIVLYNNNIVYIVDFGEFYVLDYSASIV